MSDEAVTLSPDDALDLQLHTIYSDGQWRPEALFDYLATHAFRVAAVTDHDTLAHVGVAQALGAARGVLTLAATEVTANWRGHTAHLLCYARAFTGEALARLVRETERRQLENTQAVYAELERRGYAFPRRAEVLREQSGALRRPVDNATLLLAHGYAADLPQALATIAGAGYHMVTAPIAEAVAAAHASGALAILAHPGRGGGELNRYELDELAALLAGAPLDGIEAHYPLHTPEQVAAYTAFARERGLLVSAGSDSHGPQQRLPIAYPARLCAGLLARLDIHLD